MIDTGAPITALRAGAAVAAPDLPRARRRARRRGGDDRPWVSCSSSSSASTSSASARKWFLIGTLLGPAFLAAHRRCAAADGRPQRRSRATSRDIDVIDATGIGLGDARRRRAARALSALARAVRARRSTPSRAAQSRRIARCCACSARRSSATLVLDSTTVAGRLRALRRPERGLASRRRRHPQRRAQRGARRPDGARRHRREAGRGVLARSGSTCTPQKIGDKGLEKGNPIAVILLGYVVALLLYMMIVVYGQAIMRSVLEEKTTRVAEVVVSSVEHRHPARRQDPRRRPRRDHAGGVVDRARRRGADVLPADHEGGGDAPAVRTAARWAARCMAPREAPPPPRRS